MGQTRNVALIIAITAAMALTTVAMAYLFDRIPAATTGSTTTAAEAGSSNSSSSLPGARLAAPFAIAFKAGMG